MNSIIKRALQLPREEKLELYYVLQKDLEFADNNGLTEEQWNQLNEISKQIDNGTIKKISEEEMIQFLKQRRENRISLNKHKEM